MGIMALFSSRRAAADSPLDAFWTEMAGATYYKQWKAGNPSDYNKLAAYAGGAPRPTLKTRMGKALAYELDARLAAGLPPFTLP